MNNFETKIEHHGKPVVIDLGNLKFGISDCTLVAVLSVIGIDPLTDKTITANLGRQYWVFEGDAAYKITVAFYSDYNGNQSHVSFVRRCLEVRGSFVSAAKEKRDRLNFRPLNLNKNPQ